jgi:hypothetical protein
LVSTGAPAGEPRRSEGPRVLSNEELVAIRDELAARLEQLDAMRDDLVEVLASIRTAIGSDVPERTASAEGRRVKRPRPATS